MSSKDILYTCEDGYFMPTLNVSTVKIKCDCPGSEILLSIENCTGNIYTVLTRIRAPAAIVFEDRFPPAAIQAYPYSSRGTYCF